MAEIHYGATLTDFLAAAVARFPQRPATYFAGQTLTYGELDAQVAAAAGEVGGRALWKLCDGRREEIRQGSAIVNFCHSR